MVLQITRSVQTRGSSNNKQIPKDSWFWSSIGFVILCNGSHHSLTSLPEPVQVKRSTLLQPRKPRLTAKCSSGSLFLRWMMMDFHHRMLSKSLDVLVSGRQRCMTCRTNWVIMVAKTCWKRFPVWTDWCFNKEWYITYSELWKLCTLHVFHVSTRSWLFLLDLPSLPETCMILACISGWWQRQRSWPWVWMTWWRRSENSTPRGLQVDSVVSTSHAKSTKLKN